jgi:hypothetical protein
MMLGGLDEAEPNGEYRSAATKGQTRLADVDSKSTIGKVVLLAALNPDLLRNEDESLADTHKKGERSATVCRDLLEQQNSDGGWGPYPAAQSEVFDTAVALLDPNACAATDATGEAAETARSKALQYLIKTQSPAGGWPETTRPPGGQSYAQHISTTAWALMALLMEAARSI